MEISINEIKKSARERLKGKWHLIIAITILYSAVGLVCNFIPDKANNWNPSFDIINLLVDSLLVFGYMNIILNIARGKSIDISMLFKGCTNFIKALGIKILMFIFVTLWSFLLVIPGFIAAVSYSMTFYIWVDNPDIGINEAITRSRELTDGHKAEIFKLLLSYLGWIILGILPAFIINIWFPQVFSFVLSLGMIVVEPLIAVSLATMYDKLKGEDSADDSSYSI